MSRTRIVFMGTPDFAVPSLKQLIMQGPERDWQIVGVATQPDRRAGRGKKIMGSPVKAVAQAHDIPVMQPVGLRRAPDAQAALAALAPDLLVVAAYGLILPQSVLDLPRFGAINVHASILPTYRGASPITAALLDGRDETGITIMLMDAGMDTGPVLAQASQPILPRDTTATLATRLAHQGGELLVDTLPRWLAGNLAPIDQAELPGAVSICRLIKKEDGRIDWSLPAAQIERMTRAYTPWPSAYTTWRGHHFKIIQAAVIPGTLAPGTVREVDGTVAVGTGQGLLRLVEVQPAGKRAMAIDEFRRGASDFVGAHLGA